MTKAYKFFIYKFVNKINGKCYIGQTKRPKIRYSEHRNYKDKSSLLDRAIHKYSINEFDYEIITEVVMEDFESAKKEADRLEEFYIKEYNSLYPNGYNIIPGSPKISGHKKVKSPNSRKKPKRNEDGSSPLGAKKGQGVGTIRSNEEKEKISNKLKTRVVSEETKEKLSSINKNSTKKRYKVGQVDIDTGEIIEIFDNARIASEKLNCSVTNIRNAVNGKQVSALGYKWIKIQED